MKYLVKIRATAYTQVTVEAESPDQATDIAWTQWAGHWDDFDNYRLEAEPLPDETR